MLVAFRRVIDEPGHGEDAEPEDGGDQRVEAHRGHIHSVLRLAAGLLQRKLNIGYGRASRLIEMMASSGILGDYKGSQAREVMLTLDDWDNAKHQQQTDAENGMSV